MYRVLARKYRPQTFADLIGQEVLVRTLGNAFSSGRIAHAFLLTGIRGIGKTTTARIIARGLNCTGPDGGGEPTTTPCGVCANCVAIAEDRHVDVIEMDAASNTGVDTMRELIDSVRYAPASARYKVYIIDEVHMLSKSAFNAILKTLEEPPPHVKFIFATTEIRKIPVTIISRCQRFDLRRVEIDTLGAHLIDVARRENITLDEPCATLLASAAGGSVRDALSLLDQAIALHTDRAGEVAIALPSLREMLGLADKTQSFALLAHCLTGAPQEALALARQLHQQGADPATILQDLLAITHYLTRIAVAPALAQNLQYSAAEQAQAQALAANLDVAAMSRVWQLLSKATPELASAGDALMALDMILARVAYAAQLPSLATLARNAAASSPPAAGGAPAPARATTSGARVSELPAASARAISAPSASGNTALAQARAPETLAMPQDFAAFVQLFEAQREAILAAHLVNDVRLVSFAPGMLELHPIVHLSPDVPARLARHAQEWTGQRWQIRFTTHQEGQPSLREQRAAAARQAQEYARNHPRVQAVMAQFPGAEFLGFDAD